MPKKEYLKELLESGIVLGMGRHTVMEMKSLSVHANIKELLSFIQIFIISGSVQMVVQDGLLRWQYENTTKKMERSSQRSKI